MNCLRTVKYLLAQGTDAGPHVVRIFLTGIKGDGEIEKVQLVCKVHVMLDTAEFSGSCIPGAAGGLTAAVLGAAGPGSMSTPEGIRVARLRHG